MALGDLTKQLAGQAFDALRPSEQPAPAGPTAENPQAVMLGQLQAMQKALKEDEELVVEIHLGSEKFRALEFFVPGAQVVVVRGVDCDRQPARLIARADNLQMVCRVVKAQNPVRIGFVAPRSR